MASKFSKATRKNPTETFLSTAEEPKEEAKAPAQDLAIPEGYKLVKESKSERLQLLIRPTTKKRLKVEAIAQGVSVNDLVSTILEEYLERSK